jgi:hypothetical protein
MQLDNNDNDNRKKISIQYHCNIFCTLHMVAIDQENNDRQIVYGDNSSKEWIEDW